MFKKIISYLIVFTILFSNQNIFGIFPINFFKTYDINLQPDKWQCETFEIGTLIEGSLSVNSRNNNGEKTNILQIWNNDQDALTMIRGFDPSTEIGQLSAKLNDINDDGIRGHFLTSGDLNACQYSFFGRYYLPHNFFINLFLPFYTMKLKNVNFQDLTQNITVQDQLVRQELTHNFQDLVKKLGNLDLSGWERSGPGDLVALMEWQRNFPQSKPWLKDVEIDVRAGFTIPTGVKKDEDKLLSIPFGNDGSWGILFGSRVDLTWGQHFRGGVDAEFLQLFGTTRARRIKTDKDQTDLLLLAKTNVFKEIGFNQKFNLYIEAYRVFRGLSFRIAYQYLKHGEDRFWLFDNTYSSAVVNTAESLQGWTIHEFLFILNYDFIDGLKSLSAVPNLYLFYKLPFNGTRSLEATTLGLAFSVSF